MEYTSTVRSDSDRRQVSPPEFPYRVPQTTPLIPENLAYSSKSFPKDEDFYGRSPRPILPTPSPQVQACETVLPSDLPVNATINGRKFVFPYESIRTHSSMHYSLLKLAEESDLSLETQLAIRQDKYRLVNEADNTVIPSLSWNSLIKPGMSIKVEKFDQINAETSGLLEWTTLCKQWSTHINEWAMKRKAAPPRPVTLCTPEQRIILPHRICEDYGLFIPTFISLLRKWGKTEWVGLLNEGKSKFGDERNNVFLPIFWEETIMPGESIYFYPDGEVPKGTCLLRRDTPESYVG